MPKNETLELSIAVSGGQATIDTSYEVEKISNYVDFVNLMAYDVWNQNLKKKLKITNLVSRFLEH